MAYKAAAHFDQSNWDRYGLNWLRKAKSERLQGFIINHNLNDETQQKISDMGFQVVPACYRFQLGDLCGERCLLTDSQTLPLGGLSEEYDVVCPVVKTDASDLVWSLASIENRARTVLLLQEKIKDVYGGYFSPRYILGSRNFWESFSAFETFVSSQTGYLEGNLMREELLLNLFLAFFKMKVGTDQ